jgi:putative ABC transport system permease protein
MRVGALERKLLRDAWHLRGQVLACALVVACGVTAFVTLFSTYRALIAAKDAYYAQYRFADVFAPLKRAPVAVAERLRAVAGVARLHTRIVVGVSLDVPGLAEPARGRVVSLDRDGAPQAGDALNLLHLRRGRLPEAGRQDEVVASESFAKANALAPGAAIAAVLNGRLQRLVVVGVGISPEYIYEAGPGTVLPDPRRFGVLWMDRAGLAAAFDMEGSFNDVAATLAPQASERAVLAAFDRILAPFGAFGSYGREEHFSHRFISDEIEQNRVSATTLPFVFLLVGAFLLHTILTRLVQLQRAQIGLLKAFGYSRRALVWHYLQLGLLVMALGTGLGFAVAVRLGEGMANLYADYYRFPAMQIAVTADAMLIAALLVAAAAAAAAVAAARRAARLAPAEAMRPAPPPVYGLHAVDRSRWLAGVSPGARVVVRNLVRRPWRAAANVLGIAVALAITVMAGFFSDSFERALVLQFTIVQREDLQVVFNEPRGADVLRDIARLPGVLQVEPVRAVAVRLRHAHRERRVELLGLDPGGALRWIIDARGERVPLPPAGLLVNAKLAEILALRPGDLADVDVMEGERPRLQVPVAALVAEPLGLGLYMDRRALSTALGEGERVSGALLRADAPERARLYERLKRQPAVAGVAIREALVTTFRELLARNYLVMAVINLVFAGTIAAGLVYNGARIALSERGYELATLRVLGFTRNETARLLLHEQALLTGAGFPLGLAIGAAVSFWFSLLLTTELYRLPFVLTASMLMQASATVLVAAILSGAVVAMRVRRLDLIAVLKARE